MELSYWQSRWRKGNTGFHMPGGYPALNTWQDRILTKDSRVLVPLCGKSDDLIWFAERCAGVTGVEISREAIESFFRDQHINPDRTSFLGFNIYSSNNIELWEGDFLKFPVRKAPRIDLIYDKAALVALPPSMRRNYIQKLLEWDNPRPDILLHHFIYDPDEMNGPPFSVSQTEILEAFGDIYDVDVLESNELDLSQFSKFMQRGLSGGLREQLLHLTPKSS
jgi:thiopurine S-methyltransferase